MFPPQPPKKRGWLPLLTVLFLISYALMTMLIVEQGSTIQSQRALIVELFHDSSELTATKLKAQRDHSHVAGQQAQSPAGRTDAQSQMPMTQAPMAQNPMTQNPSTQIPAAQAPYSQIPSSQATPQSGAKRQMQKPQFRMPSKPASDLSDDRRALITI
jgi:cytoskeletal protein RodZ